MRIIKPLVCLGCGSKWIINIDTGNLNPNMLKLNACGKCSRETRKKEFKAIEKKFMLKKEIPVKEVPRMTVLAEIKPYKSKRYK